MRVRIDLKIFILLFILYFTRQLKIYLIIMFFCILHEIGHLIAGVLLKMKPEKIEIMPLGFSISFYKNFEDNKLKNIIVASAGPVMSLILAILCYCINLTNGKAVEAFYSNIIILLFNLIPLYPLDGGRILKEILEIKIGAEKGSILIEKISYIVMFIITILSSITVYYYKNFMIFLICIFLWFLTIHNK